jgi:peptide/nickel transport system substrate-binding protein
MIVGVHFVNNHAGYHDSTEMKKHATEKDPWAMEWCKNHNASFGPYQVTEWKAGDRIVLDANPNYYKGAPAIKKIIRKVIPESFSRVSMLKAGTIDVARALTPKEIDSLQGVKGVNVINIPGNMCNMLFMNSKFKPWDNKLVRKAVSYAIPREEIIKTAMYGYARPMTSIGPSMYPMASSKNDFPYSYDPAKAKELLKEAGFPNGFDCELIYNPLYSPDEVAATIIKTRLSEVGINVNLKKIPYGTFFTELYRREIPFGFQTIQPFHPDCFYGLTLQWITNGFDNVYSYSDKEVDKLIEEGRGITDMEERTKTGRAIMKKVMDDAPTVWILERSYSYPMRDNIVGWNWTTWEGTYLSEVSIK